MGCSSEDTPLALVRPRINSTIDVPPEYGSQLFAAPSSLCNSTFLLFCHECACAHPARLLKADMPDTGFGNRMTKLITAAALAIALNRTAVSYWSSKHNSNSKHLRGGAGKRSYGTLDELRALVRLPRVVTWLEDWNASRQRKQSTAALFASLPRAQADEVPFAALLQHRKVSQVCGHPEGIWFMWRHWAHRHIWPPPCLQHRAMLAAVRAACLEIRPRADLGLPAERSYLALHIRSGDRASLIGPTFGYHRSNNESWWSVSTALQTWRYARAAAESSGLPFLVVAENASHGMQAEAMLREHNVTVLAWSNGGSMVGGAATALPPRAPASDSLRPVVRDFFAVASSAGVLVLCPRWSGWIDSTFSSMAALVGDAPMLFPLPAPFGNIGLLQSLGNQSGEPLREYFFSPQFPAFMQEVGRARQRRFTRDDEEKREGDL